MKFEIVGLTSDAGWGADYGAVDVFCRRLGVDYAVKASNIGPVVFEDRHEKSPCALCAHLRRGAVNAMARERGCNKVALAHHLDDAIETLLMSMLYEGRIHCFLPKTHLDKSGLFVIRPLVYVEERVVERVALDLELPVVKNPCPAAGHTKRHYVKQVVSELSAETPSIRSRLKACLKSLWRKGVPV